MHSTPHSTPSWLAKTAHSRWRIALGAALLFAVFIWAFDWTWFRPAIQHYIHERSGRSIDFDELHIGLTPALEPVVRFRGLLIQNATWAAPQPLARAGEISFTLSWRSLGADRIIVNRLVLVDADIDMEMQADGLRNWRLTHPEDRGPGKVWVLTIDAQRSRLRFVNERLNLELDTAIAPLAPVQTLAANPGLPLTKSLAIHGSHNGTKFDAQTAVSDVLSFRDTALMFGLHGTAQTGRSRIEVEGTAADILQLKTFDVAMRVATPRLADLRALLPATAASSPLPAFAPIDATANLRRSGAQWTVSQLHATVGHSDLSGDGDFHEGKDANSPSGSNERPTLRAALTSTSIDLKDFVDLGNTKSGKPLDPNATRLFASRSFDASALDRIDADLDLALNELTGSPLGTVSKLKAKASLRHGQLNLTGAQLKFAGGSAAGSLMVDGSRRPPEVAIDLNLAGLQLDRLKPSELRASASDIDDAVKGELEARMSLRSRGDSAAALAGALSGSVHAALRRASISKKLDAKLGLDGGAFFRSWFAPEERLQLTCSIVAIDFNAGRGKARRLFMETGRTAINGGGSVNLAQESLDIMITPRRKTTALLALDRSIHAQGPLLHPKITLVDPVDIATPDRCDEKVTIDGAAQAAVSSSKSTSKETAVARHAQDSESASKVSPGLQSR